MPLIATIFLDDAQRSEIHVDRDTDKILVRDVDGILGEDLRYRTDARLEDILADVRQFHQSLLASEIPEFNHLHYEGFYELVYN